MKPFEDKKRSKFRSSYFGLILLIILCGTFLDATYEWRKKSIQAHDSKVVVEKDFVELSGRTKYLDEQVAKLQTDKGLEEELRQRFDVAKSGEGVAIIGAAEVKKDDGYERFGSNSLAGFVSKVEYFFDGLRDIFR